MNHSLSRSVVRVLWRVRLRAGFRPLTTFALVATLSSLALAVDPPPYSGLYVFGDSLSDTGNVAALVGADAGQVVTGNSYIPTRPYASGTFSNGPVWVDAFAAALGLAPDAAPALAGGNNHAYASARVAVDGPGLPPSLAAQATQFLDAASGVVPGDSLYVVAGGGNDARDALAVAAVAGDPMAAIAAAASGHAAAVGGVVDQLQAAGARNIVVWDVPNLALAPAVTAQGPEASFLAGLVSQAMNGSLADRMSTEAGVGLFSVYGLVGSAVADPAAYGLTNVSDACAALEGCNPAQALFWDGIHPTSAGHAAISSAMLIAVPEPSAALLLAAGLLVLLARCRQARAGG